MGRAGTAGAIILVFCTATIAAEPQGTPAEVTLDGVEMRSGPSMQYQAAGKLPQGRRVVIHHEENGWLAVEPPVGSVSWVNHRFLGEMDRSGDGPQNVVLLGDRVQVRVGSDVDSPPLPKISTRLALGSIVEVVGPAMEWDSSVWYPITPPVGEYRYLPKYAARTEGTPASAPTPDVTLVRGSAPDPDKTVGTGEELSSARHEPGNTVPEQHPTVRQAEAAERAGDYDRAERLYTQLREQAIRNPGDYHLVLLCDNRLSRVRHQLASRRRTSTVRSSEPDPGPTPPPVTLRPPSTPDRSRTSSSAVAELRSVGPGIVRETSVFIDGRKAYALEMNQGRSWLYATAQPGVPLDRYVNRWVDLYGVVLYRSDLRDGRYLSVSRIRPRQ